MFAVLFLVKKSVDDVSLLFIIPKYQIFIDFEIISLCLTGFDVIWCTYCFNSMSALKIKINASREIICVLFQSDNMLKVCLKFTKLVRHIVACIYSLIFSTDNIASFSYPFPHIYWMLTLNLFHFELQGIDYLGVKFWSRSFDFTKRVLQKSRIIP